jgi:hypothetical protein
VEKSAYHVVSVGPGHDFTVEVVHLAVVAVLLEGGREGGVFLVCVGGPGGSGGQRDGGGGAIHGAAYRAEYIEHVVTGGPLKWTCRGQNCYFQHQAMMGVSDGL